MARAHQPGVEPQHPSPTAHGGHPPGAGHGGHPPGAGHAGHPPGAAHGGHPPGVTADSDRRWLTLALAVMGAFLVGEVVAGLLAHSLALLSDAAHLLSDVGAIVLALVAMRLAARPPRGGFTFGLKRAEILSAQLNGLTMLLLAGWLAVEAVVRLVHPSPVAGALVLATAGVGIGANAVATWAVSRANRASLNVEGVYRHILTDLFALVGTAVAGVVIIVTGFARADPIATLVVVALLVKGGIDLVRESGRVFMEAAPAGVDTAALGHRLAAEPGVVEVHDLHVWQVTSGYPALSAHVLVTPGGACHAVRVEIEALLRREYGIDHTTLQVDHAGPGVEVSQGTDPGAGLDAGTAGAAAHCVDPHGAVYRSAVSG